MRPEAIDLSPVPGLPGGEFEDGWGRGVAGDPTRRDLAAQVDHPPLVVEEEDLDREAHPERMDPSASRDQQALTGKIAIQVGKAQDPAGEGGGDGNRPSEDLRALEAAEPDRNRHKVLSAGAVRVSPSAAFGRYSDHNAALV